MNDVFRNAETLQLKEDKTFLEVTREGSGEEAFQKLMEKFDKNDKRIATFIVRNKEDQIRNDVASKLEEAQMKYWLQNEKSIEYVFNRLGLAKIKTKKRKRLESVDNLLAQPLFDYWSTYVERFNEEYPVLKSSTYDFLTPTYFEDIELVRLIINAKKKGKSAKDTALKLEKEQMQSWLDSDDRDRLRTYLNG